MSVAFGLESKVALITGGSSGIGEAVAMGLARCGAPVAVHYNRGRDRAEAIVAAARAAGVEAEAFGCDVTDEAATAAMIRAVVQRFGRIDILVNNAGSLVGRHPPEDISRSFYDQVLDLNIASVVIACRETVPVMTAQKSGAIINTGSIAGRNGGGPGAAMYASAKGFVHTYTKSLAKALAPHGVRVNAVAPGVIETPFHAATPKDTMAAMAASIPLGRLGTAEDCVGTYLYLASDRLSGYVTGQIVDVNGGMYMP